jgi:hypothetical protein
MTRKACRSAFVAGLAVLALAGCATPRAAPTARGHAAYRGPVGHLTEAPTGPGWINLLDAEHAPHWAWNQPGASTFTIENGIMTLHGGRGTRYVGYMERPFTDFTLHLEFRMSQFCNSGVMLRANAKSPAFQGMEIQILDNPGHPPSRYSCGALYDVAVPMFAMAFPAGEWNSYDITLEGRHLTVLLNGWKILDVDLAQMTQPIGKFDTPYAELPLTGHLFVQDHGHEVAFRNIFVKEL